MNRTVRAWQRARNAFAVLLCGGLLSSSGCWDSEIAKRFREGWGPGFTQGISYAISNPGQEDTGYQMAFSALFSGIGNIIDPRTASEGGAGSSGSSSSNSSNSSSGSSGSSSGGSSGSQSGSSGES